MSNRQSNFAYKYSKMFYVWKMYKVITGSVPIFSENPHSPIPDFVPPESGSVISSFIANTISRGEISIARPLRIEFEHAMYHIINGGDGKMRKT